MLHGNRTYLLQRDITPALEPAAAPAAIVLVHRRLRGPMPPDRTLPA